MAHSPSQQGAYSPDARTGIPVMLKLACPSETPGGLVKTWVFMGPTLRVSALMS